MEAQKVVKYSGLQNSDMQAYESPTVQSRTCILAKVAPGRKNSGDFFFVGVGAGEGDG